MVHNVIFWPFHIPVFLEFPRRQHTAGHSYLKANNGYGGAVRRKTSQNGTLLEFLRRDQ